MNEATLNQAAQTLELRDIHLPEPISWWPIAPGWWFIAASLIFIGAIIFLSRKAYIKKQLNRDINSELESIKKEYQQTQNKSQLAKSLSILLRRANISYFPKTDVAGLIGNQWLIYLDGTNKSKAQNFHSDTGKALLTAPYLPDNAKLDYDAQSLIQLCESWLNSAHKTKSLMASSAAIHAREITS